DALLGCLLCVHPSPGSELADDLPVGPVAEPIESSVESLVCDVIIRPVDVLADEADGAVRQQELHTSFVWTGEAASGIFDACIRDSGLHLVKRPTDRRFVIAEVVIL